MSLVGANSIAIYAVLATTGALVFGVQFLPPLTQADANGFPEFQRYRPIQGDDRGLVEALSDNGDSVVLDLAAYCRSSMSGVDCGCFRNKAARILSARNPRASGWRYADDWELAKSQAKESCS